MPESRVEIDIRIENLEEDIRTVKMHPTGDRWEGLVKAADQLTLENNHGKFLSVPKERGTDPVAFPGGW